MYVDEEMSDRNEYHQTRITTSSDWNIQKEATTRVLTFWESKHVFYHGGASKATLTLRLEDQFR
jgi:hypothetical protein